MRAVNLNVSAAVSLCFAVSLVHHLFALSLRPSQQICTPDGKALPVLGRPFQESKESKVERKRGTGNPGGFGTFQTVSHDVPWATGLLYTVRRGLRVRGNEMDEEYLCWLLRPSIELFVHNLKKNGLVCFKANDNSGYTLVVFRL